MLNKIHNIDSLKGLKMLDNKIIDCVITDPPYSIRDGKCRDNLYQDKQFYEELNEWDTELPLEYIGQLYRVMKDDRWGIIFTDKVNISKVWNELKKKKLIPRSTYYIIKTQNVPVPRCNFISAVETAVVFTKGLTNKKWRGGSRGSNGSRTPNYEIVKQLFRVENKVHPTQKLINSMVRLIKLFTDKEDVVLDCFAGSGTTLVACKQLGRKYVGFEINQKYVNIANNRLQQTNMDGILNA